MKAHRVTQLFLLLAAATGGMAQVRSGSIVGLVVDSTGAPVPDATVAVLASDTNVKSETRTNISGEYIVPYLPPGKYSVTVVRQGFVTARAADIELATAQTVRVDISLQLGTVSSTVEVAATVKELQTESATVQNTVSETLIQEVPNITHNAWYYATLQPGVASRAA